jgi:hypothetical protein
MEKESDMEKPVFSAFAVMLFAASALCQAAGMPPWRKFVPLDRAEVPVVYLAEWKKAANSAVCAPLILSGAENEKGIKTRAATFAGGWSVAYDAPGKRSAFGMAGSGNTVDGGRYRFENNVEWSDGSSVSYGLEGGVGPNYLAYLAVAGQSCLYNIWSSRGKEHLESLIDSLRTVKRPLVEEAAVIGGRRWTDGLVEYTKFEGNQSELANFNLDVKYVIDEASVTFLGGTTHEGGYSLQIRFDGPTPMTVVGDGGINFTTGDRVEYRQIAGEEMLIFHDRFTKSAKYVLKAIPRNSSLHDWVIGDFLRYAMAGTYQRPDGETHVFSPDKPCVTGFFTSGCDPYTFGEEYDAPSLIMVLSASEAFGVKKTLTGLTLTPVQKNNHDRWWEKEGAPGLTLTKIAGHSRMRGRFPLCSEQVMTFQELILHAGEPVDENLKLMRNEIFARHGYRFNTTDMQRYFGAFEWYEPEFDDVADKLSEAERINIQLIKALESPKFQE